MNAEENYNKIVQVIGDKYPRNVIMSVLKHLELEEDDEKPLHTICNYLLEEDELDPDYWLHLDDDNEDEDEDMEEPRESNPNKNKRQVGCCVCGGVIPMNQGFAMSCPGNHVVCSECTENMVNTANEEIYCPSGGCDDYTIGVTELQNFSPKLGEEYNRSLLMRLLNQKGYVQCRCNRYFEVDDPTNQELCICPKCSFEFCSTCLGPFHYDCTCTGYEQLRHVWFSWVAKTLKGQVGVKNPSRELAYQEFLNFVMAEDEKAKTCKRCPHCNRVVVRTEGCDSMICGKDYHGESKIIQGCGQNFYWTEAPEYQIPQPSENVITQLLEQAVQRSSRSNARNPFQHHIPCRVCGNQITGLKFGCVLCPDFQVCEECEADQGHFMGNHPRDHVFRIYLDEQHFLELE